jgi:N-acetylglucosaminyldiphosphoundecaprenol N-acetyl-beta-D-mannosaminyltransferase
MTDALAVVESAIAARTKGMVCVTGVHGIVESRRNPAFGSIINSSLLTIPDGRPTMWVGRLAGHRRMTQVTGPDFMLAFCEKSVRKGYRHFLYGGRSGVAQQLACALQARFPGLDIVGTYTPPFRPLNEVEEEELAHMVSHSRPDVMWVGISTPKQEEFMAEYLPKLDTTVMVGVGAAFDLHTGHIKDAPQWVKAAGLQWFHRLLQDPHRLWRRYLVNNSRFLWLISLQLLRLSKFDLL